MRTEITTFLFDIGRVLLHWDPSVLIQELIVTHDIDDEDALYKRLEAWEPLWNVSTVSDWAGAVAVKEPEYAGFTADFAKRMTEAIFPLIEENVNLTARLKQRGYRLYTASNFPTDTFNRVKDRFSFLEHFDGIYISGETGLLKPDPAFFTDLLGRYNIAPEEAVFIDDMDDNVESARSLGIKSIICRNPAQLEAELEEFL